MLPALSTCTGCSVLACLLNRKRQHACLLLPSLATLPAERPLVPAANRPHCSYDLKGLREHLEEGGYRCDDFPEVLYSRYVRRTGETSGDIFTFEFGTGGRWPGGRPVWVGQARNTLHAGAA